MSSLRLLGAAGVLALVLASPAAAHKRHHHHHHKPKDVKVQLLSINDFHGNLQTSTTGGIRPPTPAGGTAPAPHPGGRRRGPRQLPARARAQEPQHADRRRGRPDRRQPAAVGALPRRAHDRGHEPARARPRVRRQPRVRRRRRRAQAHAARRLSPDRRLQGRRRLRGREVPLPGRQRGQQAQRQAVLQALRDPSLPGQEDRVHRHDARGDAEHRRAGGHLEPLVPRRGRDRQPLRA